MKYVFILLLIVACTNKKAMLVDRQKAVKSELNITQLECSLVKDTMDKVLQYAVTNNSLSNDSEWRRLAKSLGRLQIKAGFLQSRYDSLEWELKKY